MRSMFCCDVMVFSRRYADCRGSGAEVVEQAAGTVSPIADAEERQRLPNHRLIAGHHRAAELLLDALDDREHGDVGATQEIDIGIGPRRLERAVAPKLRR